MFHHEMHRRIVAERGFLIVARHGRCLLFWWVDPSGGGQCGRLRGNALEADGMGSERGIEGDGALLGERRSGAVVDGGRSHQADTAVAMFVVVPVEEVLAVSAGVLDRAETIGEVRSVLQGFELRLGVWIVIRDMRAAVGLGNIEVDEERGDRLRSHAGTAIGMERKGPGGDVFLFQGVGDELLGEFCGLSMSEQPTDDVAAVLISP